MIKKEAKTLKDYRLLNGFTMEFIAEKLNMHPQTYAKYELFPENLSIKQAKEIASIFNVSVNDIFFKNKL